MISFSLASTGFTRQSDGQLQGMQAGKIQGIGGGNEQFAPVDFYRHHPSQLEEIPDAEQGIRSAAECAGISLSDIMGISK